MSTTLEVAKRTHSQPISPTPVKDRNRFRTGTDFKFDPNRPVAFSTFMSPRIETRVMASELPQDSAVFSYDLHLDTGIPLANLSQPLPLAAFGGCSVRQPRGGRGLDGTKAGSGAFTRGANRDRKRQTELDECLQEELCERVRKALMQDLEPSVERLVKECVESRRTPRRKKPYGGRGVKKDVDYWLDRWERDVLNDLKKEGCTREEAPDRIIERVKALSSREAAAEINKRYRRVNSGEDVISEATIRRRKCGAFCSGRWADWECFRKGAAVANQVVDGSLDNDADIDSPELRQHLGAEGATDAEDVGDNRRRSVFDGGLVTADMGQAAEEELRAGCLRKHEGGIGISHLRPASNEDEILVDQLDQQADDFLEQNGIAPDVIHREPKRRHPQAVGRSTRAELIDGFCD